MNAKKINTGNYRLCKDKTGIGNSLSIIEQSTEIEKLEVRKKFETNINPLFNYFIQEEVFYEGTQLDSNRNPISSSTEWQRKN